MSMSGKNYSSKLLNGKVLGKQCPRFKTTLIILCQEAAVLNNKSLLKPAFAALILWLRKDILWILGRMTRRTKVVSRSGHMLNNTLKIGINLTESQAFKRFQNIVLLYL